jgi:uncharacterized phiE125 gp8 family phage protein
MAYKVITPVAAEPLTTAEAKLHLRVDVSDDDAIIAALITAAREFAEHYTGRALAPQTLEMGVHCFPSSWRDSIDLDMPPVASVTSVKYLDAAGVEQTVPAADYTLSSYGDARCVTLDYGLYWPITQDVPDAVRIRYVTGYTTLPKAARAALLLVIGHLYENREAVSALKLDEIPMGARALLDTIKIWSR